jgi:hypothetical protein
LFFEVFYNDAMQPLVNVTVGGQVVELVFDTSSGDTFVLVGETNACESTSVRPCYSFRTAQAMHSLRICQENLHQDCRLGRPYECTKYLQHFGNETAHRDELVIDGLRYLLKSVEALDSVEIRIVGDRKDSLHDTMPMRLVVAPMDVLTPHSWLSLKLFRQASGLLGASGPSLSCRGKSVWSRVLKHWNVSLFTLDFQPPPQAIYAQGPTSVEADSDRIEAQETSRAVVQEDTSRVVLNQMNPLFEQQMTWSQPKQTGDLLNDGMHEFLMFHPSVCGVDLLYNTSSNWLTVLDTSGPCLSLPQFLFDRLRTHIPVDCPFELGKPSAGRLCSPLRGARKEGWAAAERSDGFGGPPPPALPALRFQLQDVGTPAPRDVYLPLERLVFRNTSGAELLCVARDDGPSRAATDMLFSHIAFGSMVASVLYTVVDLRNHTIGLAQRGNWTLESTDAFCTPPITCQSPMQTYFPPLNLCEDPRCSEYLFMTLDEKTKTCVWSRAVPALLGVVLASLLALDLLGHGLYARATAKAGAVRS